MKIKKQAIIFVLLCLFFISLSLKPIQADNTNNVDIINIQTQPSAIKVGDVFTITATLVNNSTNVIKMSSSSCVGSFTTVFDSHAKIKENGLSCTAMEILRALNPGEKIIGTSPGLDYSYMATTPGIANATIVFSYSGKNQTDPNQSEIGQTISKSFLFTIYDNNTNFQLTNDAPLKQIKSGVAIKDVKCTNNFQLIFKAEDGSPACVKPDTSKILIERGWAKPV